MNACLKDKLFFFISNFETTFAMHDGRKSEIPVRRCQVIVYARCGSIAVEIRTAVRVMCIFPAPPCMLIHDNLLFFKTLRGKGLIDNRLLKGR